MGGKVKVASSKQEGACLFLKDRAEEDKVLESIINLTNKREQIIHTKIEVVKLICLISKS